MSGIMNTLKELSKNKSVRTALSLLVAAMVVLVFQSIFTLHQVEQALVVQLGSPKRVVTEPGLHLKVPFIEEVHVFDKRLLEFDQESQEVLSSDKKNLRVDNYARWRIVNPLVFYQTVRNEVGAKSRLNDIIYSNLREVLGQFTMMEIVSGARVDLMERIRKQTNKQANEYGIEVVDVRIKRTDLPSENSKAVFRRMQTERQRQAKQYRAEGEEEAAKIRAMADRDRKVILANAYETSQKLRGLGDAESTRIYAEAYQTDADFYAFTRSLEAYRKAFDKKTNTTAILKPTSDFFRFFENNDL